ncbi:MAG: dTDP-4-dehydrorhamnose reductase [Chloroflexi bacterium]|nr:dTDP-4-dehydrorhamnose reductase [Chloroflexota bacterium]
MRILITGAAGKLGSQLIERLRTNHEALGADILGDVEHFLDIEDYDACCSLVNSLAPTIVLHAAAWTDVNGCALDPARALRINGLGTHNLAACCAIADIPMLYVSTNEVFDGLRNHPYREYDSPNPQNAYGYSKCYGERALLQINPRHYIVRTAWLFAHGGSNFIQAILTAAKAGKPLRVVTNEIANPTYTNDLAGAIARLIETNRFGTYHLVNQGAVSRWQFARYVLDRVGYCDTPIERITRQQWQRPSLPPEYTALKNIEASSLAINLRPWQEGVDAFLKAEGFTL